MEFKFEVPKGVKRGERERERRRCENLLSWNMSHRFNSVLDVQIFIHFMLWKTLLAVYFEPIQMYLFCKKKKINCSFMTYMWYQFPLKKLTTSCYSKHHKNRSLQPNKFECNYQHYSCYLLVERFSNLHFWYICILYVSTFK